MFKHFLLFFIAGLVCPALLFAQQRNQRTISVDFKDASIAQALHEINQRSGNSVTFREEIVVKESKKITLKRENITVWEAVNIVLEGTNLTCKQQDNGKILVGPKQADETLKITGRVVDDKGDPIAGATIIIHGTTVGVASDGDGRYTIPAKANDILQVSFIGYKTEVVPINGKIKVDVVLKPTAENLEEVAVIAFGTQKKESVVSAITTVRPMDLKSSNSDLTSSFTGKIAGIVGWQTGGIPGALTEEEMNTKFYIRGITSFQTGANIDPLILLDGVESSKLDLARLAPEDIETFSVLKDASATAMYGARGANGVILVTTKKGSEGSVYASVRYEAIMSMPTREIDVVDPLTYMKMYNQALLARDVTAQPKYSQEVINRTASGKYPSWLYPQNNWYDIMFKDHSVNHHLGLNIRGGSKIVQYYASINYNRDQGMLKTDKLNDFDCNITNNQTSFRVNLNIDLNTGIKLVVTSSAFLDKYHGPLTQMGTAYWYAFNASPVDFAVLYPGDDTYNWPHLRFGTTASGATNPYRELQKGYLERTRFSTINRAEYIQNLSSLLKGLELRASVSYSQAGYYTNGLKTDPFMYSLVSYDFETKKHVLQDQNMMAHRTLVVDEGSTGSTSETQVTYEVQALHSAAWGDHQSSLTAVFQAQDRNYSPIRQVLEGMPQRNLTYSMRGTYGYKDRYFVEASFGYNGSERFAKDNRFGFFPAGGVAYVMSNEPFMLPLSNWLSFLKFRASWGKVGNDGVIEKPRFVFLPTIGSVYGASDPQAGASTFTRYKIDSYANEGIQWEIAEQINFGLETKLFKGLVEINLDAYQEIRHNILSKRTTIPASVGLEEAPLDNVGKARGRGIDFSGKIQHAISNDFWFILNGTLTYSKAIYQRIEEATNKPSWQWKKGHELSQQVGYVAEGLFHDQAEIDNSPRQGGDVMPGDIRYRDINNDGVIDVNDAVHIGYPETPRLIYGFSGFLNYKNIEFSFAFQGSGNRSFFMDPKQISPFDGDHAMLKAIYKDYWSENNMADQPFWPRLSTYNLIHHNPQEDWQSENSVELRKSTYFMRSCRFLRCSSLELAYNMPEKLMRKLRFQNMKFFVRTNNPFLISNFKVWDVELGENGFNYPIQKTYTVGLNFSF